jgi:hypothetical protein
MTFYDREGADGVRPAELLIFSRGQGARARVWRYATSDADVVLDGLTYKASTLTRSAIHRNQSSGKTSLTITMATGTPFVSEWLVVDPLDALGTTALTLLRVHLADDGSVVSASSDQRVTAFVGTVAGVTLDGAASTVECEGLESILAQSIPRVAIARTCPWSVYGRRCGLNPVSFQRPGTIASVGVATFGGGSDRLGLLGGTPAVTLTMSGGSPVLTTLAADPHHFDGGVLVWVDGTRTVRVHIASADLSLWPTVTALIHTPMPSVAVGAAINVWPGCLKTLNECNLRFSNLAHFGGFPRLPERSPLVEGLR